MSEATVIAPPAPPVTQPTIEQLVAQLSLEKKDWLQEQLQKLADKLAKEKEKDAATAQTAALAAKRDEFFAAIRSSVKDVIPALGITIPEKGFKFALAVNRAPDGSAMVDIADSQTKRAAKSATSSNGAKASTGASGKSITQIGGISGFILPNGSEVKTAADVCRALGWFKDGDNQGRVIVTKSLGDVAQANTVKAVHNGSPVPMGDLVQSHFGKKVEAPAS